ncbi:hydantoinase/oxoprolinase family protein [Nonomuraea sp. NPDC049129]|uniref:hydantoinase/oxoprolinase family protein n=1 Tax=Nonomuraea sp. NPDC049129 TaxID=3155272 RepID=UPI0033E00445
MTSPNQITREDQAGAFRRIAVEIGGTFTDCVFETEQGALLCAKVPSTPGSPELSVQHALERMSTSLEQTQEFLHGSTVATNAVIERKGAPTAFVTTEGFRDILELQRGARTNIYDLQYVKPAPLVTRDHAHEVTERITAAGEVLTPLAPDSLDALARRLETSGVRAVAVTLLHSYANAEHETRVQEYLNRALPGLWVDISSDVAPEFREYERASTTAMSAYLGPRISTYLSQLHEDLGARGFAGRFMVMKSSGGLQHIGHSHVRPVEMLESGPVAGAGGAAEIALRAGVRSVITFDMGGTSTDIAVIDDGRLRYASQSTLDGLPVRSPTADISSVGAGGGSIASIDAGGLLQVGPESAGADPGPACYGRGGTRPTVTDAHVVRGVIRPESFIGGEWTLDGAAAERAIAALADDLGATVPEAAEAVVRLADENTINAIRIVTMERGLDPRDYTLVAYGGAGPLHAARVAEELGCPEVLVPPNAGMLSAFGLLVAPLQATRTATRIRPAAEWAPQDLEELYQSLDAQVRAELRDMGAPEEAIQLTRILEGRYIGQAYELSVLAGAPAHIPDLVSGFHQAHEERYSRSRRSEPIEFVSYRVRGECQRDFADLASMTYPSQAAGGGAQSADIKGSDGNLTAVFTGRARLSAGDELVGPAVVEESTSACYVPRGWTARVDEHSNLRLSRRNP